MSRERRGLMRVAFTTILGCAGVCATPALAAADTTPTTGQPMPLMSLAPGSLPFTLTQSANVPGGHVATTWSGPGGVVVRAAGDPGSTVDVVQTGPNSFDATVTPPPSAPSSAASYAASGSSVYYDARAVGDTPAEAAAAANSAGASVPGSPSSSTPSAMASSGSIFHSNCATEYKYGGLISTKACVVQKWLQTGSGSCGCWYSSNTVTSSGTAQSGDRLYSLRASFCYCNGYAYRTVGWSPSASRSVGSPTTYTLTAIFGPFSASVQETQYPGTLNPNWPNGTNNAAFGSDWNGSAGNGSSVSANSVALVNPGVGSPGDASARVGFTSN